MINFYDRIKVKFNNDEGEFVETHNVKHLIERNIIPQYECVEDEFINDLMRKVEVKFQLGLGKKIIFTGGGSITLKSAITRYRILIIRPVLPLPSIKGCIPSNFK